MVRVRGHRFLGGGGNSLLRQTEELSGLRLEQRDDREDPEDCAEGHEQAFDAANDQAESVGAMLSEAASRHNDQGGECESGDDDYESDDGENRAEKAGGKDGVRVQGGNRSLIWSR